VGFKTLLGHSTNLYDSNGRPSHFFQKVGFTLPFFIQTSFFRNSAKRVEKVKMNNLLSLDFIIKVRLKYKHYDTLVVNILEGVNPNSKWFTTTENKALSSDHSFCIFLKFDSDLIFERAIKNHNSSIFEIG
jgi:hypothetical protein|tara:strand:- start:144 stop:536 length:393 start_codon:yes stop_codon:yes gene_type:complete